MRNENMRSIAIAAKTTALMTTALMTVLLTAPLAGSAAADEKTVQLKQAPGLDKVESGCSGCHSLDYVPMNSPFLAPAAWDAEVAKMINAFGAPIDPADAKTIADYLKSNYGM
jgi:mono/diheme cytochrome c family protein